MANHVVNQLVVTSKSQEDLMKFYNFVNCGENGFDFNSVLPMPNELEDTEVSPRVNKGIYHYLLASGKGDKVWELLHFNRATSSVKEDVDDLIEVGEKYYKLHEKYGAFNWAMWRKNNWGCERNPYNAYAEMYDDTLVFLFTTSNFGVPNIIKKLTEMFPNLWFDYKYADEDIACNCGEGSGNAEQGFNFNVAEDESDKALQIYLECWDEDIEDICQDSNGHYHHIDFEDEDDE